MIDKFFSYLSEWAPMVALAGCVWCAFYGTIEMVLACGFAAVVLELHDMSYAFIELVIGLVEGFDNEWGDN